MPSSAQPRRPRVAGSTPGLRRPDRTDRPTTPPPAAPREDHPANNGSRPTPEPDTSQARPTRSAALRERASNVKALAVLVKKMPRKLLAGIITFMVMTFFMGTVWGENWPLFFMVLVAGLLIGSANITNGYKDLVQSITNSQEENQDQPPA
jgi:hypothetical protein